MQPIDYSIDVQTPFQAAMQGYAGGAAIRDDQAKQQQQQAAQAQQQAMQRDLAELAQNPSADAIAKMSMRYPQLSEQFKRSYDMWTPAQQQNELNHATQVYAAVQSGRPDVAAQMLRDRAAAMRNSGMDDKAQTADRMAQWAETHPDSFKTTAGLMLSSVMGADKFATTFSTLGAEKRAEAKAPADLRTAEAGATKAEADAVKAGADATKAGIDAKYAEQVAITDLQKKGWDIKALQEDIGFKREANRIALMNAQATREGNALKREELQLKIQEARNALDEKIRAKVADTEAAATSIDNSLNTIQRIKTNKSLNDVLGSIEGRLPAVMSDEAADAIALIDTLGSQAFLSQAANLKGMGALSNAEGEKLQSALTNLSRKQSESQFRANLDEASRLLKKGRETLSKRTGVPVGSPDTPAAPGSRPPLSSFEGR